MYERISYISTTIQKTISKTANTSVLIVCIIWDHRGRMIIYNFQNFTNFSRTSIHLYSGRIVGLTFCYSPTFRHWTAPSALSGSAQMDLYPISGNSPSDLKPYSSECEIRPCELLAVPKSHNYNYIYIYILSNII